LDQLQDGLKNTRQYLAEKIGPDPKDQIEALIYLTSSLNVQIAHERNYNVIFGSQLQLLAQANGAGGVRPIVARNLYEAAKSTHPEVYRTFSFEQWIGFLQEGGLITVESSGNYLLTSYGRGFLKYIVDRQHPVRTAAWSLWWRVAMEQVGVGFVHLDELDEIVDAGACEGRYRLFTEAKNGETAVFRVHFDADLVQPVLVFADHFGDTGDGEDVAYPGHDQAA
jgi:hypothetical protein